MVSVPETEGSGANAEFLSVPAGLSPSAEDYYPTVAINALMKVLRDASLSAHHTAVIQAVMYIFKTLGLKCVPFLPRVFLSLLFSLFLLKST